MDRRKYIAELVEKTGVRIDEDDPIFAVVMLNQLILQDQKTELEALVGKLVMAAAKVPSAALEQFKQQADPVLNKALGSLRTEAVTLKDDLGDAAERAVDRRIASTVELADSAVRKLETAAGIAANSTRQSVWIAAILGGIVGGAIVALSRHLLF
jgi:hypothetical protein